MCLVTGVQPFYSVTKKCVSFNLALSKHVVIFYSLYTPTTHFNACLTSDNPTWWPLNRIMGEMHRIYLHVLGGFFPLSQL